MAARNSDLNIVILLHDRSRQRPVNAILRGGKAPYHRHNS
ncbi:hypothetical protein HMPREF1605_04854 [Escherichia coli 908521]|nr:hypothetical protein HMPREF1599_05667 [Escherichia coli 907713]ESD46501.1 hypothetical protein HMPREF1605_04854 [Escherichia coli 908521]